MNNNLDVKTNITEEKQILIQKIKFEGSNKFIIYKLLNSSILIKKNCLKRNIYSYIKSLQKSGYINKLKILQLNYFNKDYSPIIIQVKTNPIINKIYIKKYSNLIVYKKFLIKLFKDQIGLPKNYMNIMENLQTIKRWYKKQNFNYVQVKLLDSTNPNHLFIEINEGIINHIKIIEENNQALNKFISNKVKQIIDKSLGIQRNDIFNTRKVEESLLNLKKIPFLKECNYQVEYFNNQINLTIYYIVKDCSLLNSNYKNIIYKHKIYAVTNFYKKYIRTMKKCLTNYTNKKPNYILRYNNINSYSINLSNFFPRIKLINIPFTKKITFIYIKEYEKSSLSSFPQCFIKKYKLKEFQISNCKKKSSSINIIQNYLLHLHMKIKNYFIFTKENSEKSKINLKTLHSRQLTKKDESIKPLFKPNYKTIVKLFRQMIYLKLSFEYNQLFISEYLIMGNIFIVDSIIYYTNNFSYSLTNMYMYASKIPNLYSSIIKIYMNTNLAINLNHEQNNKHSCNNIESWLNSKIATYLSSISFYLFNIEYHLHKSKYISIYIFYNTIQTFLNINAQIYFDYEGKLSEIQQGIGLQINIPIQILSNIRILYTQQYKSNKSLISFKYYSISDIIK